MLLEHVGSGMGCPLVVLKLVDGLGTLQDRFVINLSVVHVDYIQMLNINLPEKQFDLSISSNMVLSQ